MAADGSVSPGMVADGSVSPGMVPAGLVRLGSVSAGLVIPGLSPGEVSPGLIPGEVSPGEVSPGEVNPGEVAGMAPAGLRPVGTGGRLIPNWDRPWLSADISSLGRSVTTAARTNSGCSGAEEALALNSDTVRTANGLATAKAATALMAVESLRRRRFGTEVSSMWNYCIQVVQHGREPLNSMVRV
ncbi:hypothetical protein MKOR_32840 [Mycolicibacillus koreensis]|nr:hypothetical protein MKOR_32840 [Mycolicibacillus koreensis]